MNNLVNLPVRQSLKLLTIKASPCLRNTPGDYQNDRKMSYQWGDPNRCTWPPQPCCPPPPTWPCYVKGFVLGAVILYLYDRYGEKFYNKYLAGEVEDAKNTVKKKTK